MESTVGLNSTYSFRFLKSWACPRGNVGQTGQLDLGNTWDDISKDVESKFKKFENRISDSFHDRFDRNHKGGYIAGVLAGVALGAILTYIFAPARDSRVAEEIGANLKKASSKIKNAAANLADDAAES